MDIRVSADAIHNFSKTLNLKFHIEVLFLSILATICFGGFDAAETIDAKILMKGPSR